MHDAKGLFRALLLPGILAMALGLRAAETASLTIAVMDPLAKPLSCACVKGFAQRDYDRLGKFLEGRVGRPVRVVYAESLRMAALLAGVRGVDAIIGKASVVEADAESTRTKVRAVARLTDNEGKTTLTGLFVVPSGSPAQDVASLKGYRVIFGPADSDEKHAAAIETLRAKGIDVPEKPETRSGCSEAAFAALESDAKPGAAAVISSYAMAILEGCGTIEKGSLRVVGKTGPVPFVTVFLTDAVDSTTETVLLKVLGDVRKDPDLLLALESRDGFERVEKKPEAGSEWPGWRGLRRDGIVEWLPETLPERPTIVWKREASLPGLGGVAVASGRVIYSDRSPQDTDDVFVCLDAETGEVRWRIVYRAVGSLDFGNSPRATPLVHEGSVYLLGAFGHLHRVRLDDGSIVWRKHLPLEFGAKLPTWGMCGSPLIVDGKLIVNPGARDASLVAVRPETGDVLWKAAGLPAAYSSFIVGSFGGVRQLVGYDSASFGGWDPETGRRLWHLVPPEEGDYNVPTPIDCAGRLLVSTENNGTRLYAFDETGRILPDPVASNDDLRPDTSTAVVLGDRVVGCPGRRGVYCLDLSAGLETRWHFRDEELGDYVTVLGSEDRVLLTTTRGELLLLRVGGDGPVLLGRTSLFSADEDVYAHPALVGRRLYVRGAFAICCVDLTTG